MSVSCTTVGLVACRVLEPEITALLQDTMHVMRREYFETGLHDEPQVLRERLAAAVARAEADWAADVVVITYGLCGLGLVGLTARRRPLIVPRAHSCLTLLLGSKERYAECMRAEPGTYWYSPGWNRHLRVPGPHRDAKLKAEYATLYGSEEAAALLRAERSRVAGFSAAAYTDLGLPGDEKQRCYAEQCAKAHGWPFRHYPGDPSLLHDLLYGPWDDERFLIVKPGQRIVHTGDSRIIGIGSAA